MTAKPSSENPLAAASTQDMRGSGLSVASISGIHRRRKLMRIPTRYVLALLSRSPLRNQYINVLEPVGLPETAIAIGVWPEYQYDAFAVIVEDASFDEVPDGRACPEIEVQWSIVKLYDPRIGAEGECAGPNCALAPKRAEGEK